MNRVGSANWLGIPYMTMQEWELERRGMPEYVLRLIAYKVRMEKMIDDICKTPKSGRLVENEYLKINLI